MDAEGFPEAEDPTERMPVRWFDEVESTVIELDWVELERRAHELRPRHQ
jgi:hypothetical protein